MTGHSGWLCLGGAEIANQARAFAYAQSGECPSWSVKACDSCGPEMAVALEDTDGVYTTPAADPAPWFDATEPQSGDFYGLYVLSVDNLGPGRITRDVTARASGYGSFLGPEVFNSPTVIVTGVLMGKTACAVDFGMRWLGTVLRGPACADGCTGEDLTFLNCCPTWTADPVADIEPHLRTLKGVKLTASPVITDLIGDSCSCHPDSADMVQVQFALTASEPCVFRPPVESVTDVPFDIANPSECERWNFIGEGDVCPADNDCSAPADCIADPNCPAPPAPPVAPTPRNPCICEPGRTVQACATIDSSLIPAYAEGVPIITIKSGSKDLRQVRMTFIANPFNQPIEDLDPCTACGEVTLSRIPAGSEFVMDGTDESVTILCPGSGPTDATPLLGSTGGQLPFRFPQLQCGGMSYVLCVTADSVTTAADASISASIAVKECS